MSDSYAYEMPWRPNYEAYALAGWLGSMALTAGIQWATDLPLQPCLWAMTVQGALALRRIPGALRMSGSRKKLLAKPPVFLEIEELFKQIAAGNKKGEAKAIDLGVGYEWGQAEGQMIFEIMKRDIAKLMPPTPAGFMGAPWIHGITKKKDVQITMPTSQASLHTLILGTTGSGKTRLFDLMISQAIARNEPVIIIDPKGDKELAENARRACELAGSPERFLYFHPAFPEKSVSISPTANYNRLTEIASRVAGIMPSSSGGDPFKSFAQMAVNNVCQALDIAGEPKTLVNIRRYMEGGPAPLVIAAVTAYGREKLERFDEQLRPYMTRANNEEMKARAMSTFYRSVLQEEFANPDLEGILSMFEHDRAHFGKMIASLLPVLNMLTSGAMAELLSPSENDPLRNTRIISDTSNVVDKGMVLYMGLDSLSDQMVGQAIGSIFLADLASVLGRRYNQGVTSPLNIFVDECAEVINDQLIQALNKGRGSGANLAIASQTIADFEARMGSEAKARQVLGNTNHLIALRITDPATQEYVTTKLPLTRYSYVMRTQGWSSGESPELVSGNLGERLMEEEGELFQAQLLGMLPNLEYVGVLSGGRVVKAKIPILTRREKMEQVAGGKQPEEKSLHERMAEMTPSDLASRAWSNLGDSNGEQQSSFGRQSGEVVNESN